MPRSREQVEGKGDAIAAVAERAPARWSGFAAEEEISIADSVMLLGDLAETLRWDEGHVAARRLVRAGERYAGIAALFYWSWAVWLGESGNLEGAIEAAGLALSIDGRIETLVSNHPRLSVMLIYPASRSVAAPVGCAA